MWGYVENTLKNSGRTSERTRLLPAINANESGFILRHIFNTKIHRKAEYLNHRVGCLDGYKCFVNGNGINCGSYSPSINATLPNLEKNIYSDIFIPHYSFIMNKGN
jgi:hypothetical protein